MASSQSNGGNGVYSPGKSSFPHPIPPLPSPPYIPPAQLTNVSPLPELRLHHFQRSITLSLFLWPSLSLAVTSSWGGPTSTSKREWFAGTLIDLLSSPENYDVDAEWIEELLLQVMEDEFEVVVDDGSAAEVARGLIKCRGECERGVWGEENSLCKRLEGKWGETGGKELGLGGFREGEEQGDTDGEDSGDGESGDEEDGDVEMEMNEAPQLVRAREPIVPEVDEDGFTKVTKKRR
ncbi:hypothetical protein SBOR_9708 [Sclerotinia borealis F-4128]|uniref:Pre-rRNA-processing protein TSR2 n=1 Tax=Sclerotinia borealis (strain F-4128) TaxID=1432307 RepID=W9C5T2_SCLBF|nr:hypothetical protein SBOR_9708 [Sclerotinia borealis F-4128]